MLFSKASQKKPVVTDEEGKSIKGEMGKRVLPLIGPRIIPGREVLIGKEDKFCSVPGGFPVVTAGDFLNIIHHTSAG